MLMPVSRVVCFRVSIAIAILFWLAHLVSLPLLVTYDGLGYLDLSDVLFSSRFPHDWLANRTPLFPLALKISFDALGRQPLAAILVPSAMALLGVLVLGDTIRRTVGEWAASFAIVFVSIYPTLVTYEHAVLTETGTFFFLAVICWILLWCPARGRFIWAKSFLLAITLAVGFYWRQTILYVAVPATILYALSEWKRGTSSFQGIRQDKLQSIMRAGIIAFLPFCLAKPWDRVASSTALLDVTLRQGIIRQALLPPNDPYVGENRGLYVAAIRDSSPNGNFYSGVTWPKLTEVGEKLYAKPLPGNARQFFLHLIWTYPGRYLKSLGRSILFFAGVPGVESDNRSFREAVLSKVGGSKISEGPQPLETEIKEQFAEVTTSSIVLRRLRGLMKTYDLLVPVGAIITALGLIGAILLRDLELACFCSIPLFYLLAQAVTLVTIDRFMVPIYPFLLANLLIVPLLLEKRMHLELEVYRSKTLRHFKFRKVSTS